MRWRIRTHPPTLSPSRNRPFRLERLKRQTAPRSQNPFALQFSPLPPRDETLCSRPFSAEINVQLLGRPLIGASSVVFIPVIFHVAVSRAALTVVITHRPRSTSARTNIWALQIHQLWIYCPSFIKHNGTISNNNNALCRNLAEQFVQTAWNGSVFASFQWAECEIPPFLPW